MAFFKRYNGPRCSLCQNIDTDCATLQCGHSYCQGCTTKLLKRQDQDGFYRCRICRKRTSLGHSLQNKKELPDRVRPVQVARVSPWRVCVYCNDRSASNVQKCVQCVGTLRGEHLGSQKTPGHQVINPTSLGNRKCSVHNKRLDYYCTEDGTCICPDCGLLGEHKGHNVESLEEASKKRKEQTQKVLERLVSKREDAETKVCELSEHQTKEEKKAYSQELQVISLSKHLTEQIQKVEKAILTHIASEREHVVQTVVTKITKLNEESQELSKRIQSIEELCKIDDPLRFLQNWKPDGEEIGNLQEMDDTEVPTIKEIDVNLLLQRVDTSISDILKDLHTQHTPQSGSSETNSVEDSDSLENSDAEYTDQSEEMDAEPQGLHCPSPASEQYPRVDVHLTENSTTVNLHIIKKGKKTKIFTCVSNDEDLRIIPGNPSTCSAASDSEKAKTFLKVNYENLCKRLGILEPILLSLSANRIITDHEEQAIKNHKLDIEKRRALLMMVTSKGVEEKFYQILKDNDPFLLQSLEKPTKKD